MAGENDQKIKLLKLMEMLNMDSDEENPMTTSEICRRLAEMNITCDERTVGRDMKYLNERGYEVMDTRVGREKAYYVDERSFSLPEIKILMDAVQAAGFITSKKTAELTDKIAALGGSHRAELLKGNIVSFNTRKHSNELIFYSIEALEQALLTGKQASFLYFDLDEKKKRVYRKNGERYEVEPLALVYNEDNYYLVCYNSKHGSVNHYRVDRMEKVECMQEPLSDGALEYMKANDMSTHTGQAFKMFGGEAVNVKLRFRRGLTGSVYDKFGEVTKISPVGPDYCTAMVKVQVSPTFFGWVFQFNGDMQILSPKSVINKYKEQLKAAADSV